MHSPKSNKRKKLWNNEEEQKHLDSSKKTNTHIILITEVIVYPTMVPQSMLYCVIPHINTSFRPARTNSIKQLEYNI